MFFIFFLPFLTALLGVMITTPLTIKLSKRFGIMDDPKTHVHPAIIHKKPIPRAGSIPFYFGIFLAGFLFLPKTKITLALFIASLITLIIGIIDDKKGDLSRYFRFLINIFCAILVVGSGVGISYITNPLGGILHIDAWRISFSFLGQHSVIVISDIIAVVWLVWIMNMLNWSKGVDGQMPGIVAISAIIIGILSLRFPLSDAGTLLAANLSFIIAGAAIGFLFYNFYPAKIFPGYGATAIYLLLGVDALLPHAKLATAILVMGIPMVDGGFTVLRRILSRKSIFHGDKKHLHHLLLQKGLSQRQIALFYWVFSAILGTIALLLPSKGKVFAIIMLLVIVGGGLLFLHKTVQEKENEIGI